MMLDPTRVGLNVVIPDCHAEHPLIESMMKLAPELTVLKVITRGDGASLSLTPKLLSCVSVVEYVIGVGFKFCITPHQLYKKLKKCQHSNLFKVTEVSQCQQEKALQREARD